MSIPETGSILLVLPFKILGFSIWLTRLFLVQLAAPLHPFPLPPKKIIMSHKCYTFDLQEKKPSPSQIINNFSEFLINYCIASLSIHAYPPDSFGIMQTSHCFEHMT